MEVLHRRPAQARIAGGAPLGGRKAAAERHLPPKVPEDIATLEEATTLLGAFLQADGKLRESRRERLASLIGKLPSLEVARAWKSGLKELRSELAALEARR